MTLQKFMTSHFGSYNPYRPTGFYGEATRDGVREFQKRTGITGPDADGSVVGPRTLGKLREYGFTP
jgi:peptidoglycan hydrolase-like protein with peptidoglycan-binding domain